MHINKSLEKFKRNQWHRFRNVTCLHITYLQRLTVFFSLIINLHLYRAYSNSKAEGMSVFSRSFPTWTSAIRNSPRNCYLASWIRSDNTTEFNLTATCGPRNAIQRHHVRQISGLRNGSEKWRIENARILRRKVLLSMPFSLKNFLLPAKTSEETSRRSVLV